MDQVVHFELPADDINRAKTFYSKVFGWSIQTFDPEYFLATTVETDEEGQPEASGAINGGIKKRKDKSEAPVIVVHVDDIDASIAKAEKHGGKVVLPKMIIDHIMYYARVQDCEGNVIGIGQNID
jgi:predicted enzyme related to lactoylglutathione lyase